MSDEAFTIEIDGREVEVMPGQMLIEVTDRIGNYVPRFCYHNKLSVAANCRMCLVEVEKAPKPLPACATPVMNGMKVHTRSELALDAQKSVMEFLLINHPLDCPICDQGGECELQDLAVGYGRDVSRYQEKKRVVKDRNIGPLVQTDMTRCIHCTRCVRFGEEIAGLRELGATGRSEFMEIGTYIEKSMASELSGNVIDLCPVGALTSKPFRFSARTWEMTQHNGIAPHDGVGSNIHFHVQGDRIRRVVPAENEAVNEVWLSDRDRFSYEGLHSAERLTEPMLRDEQGWREVDWQTAIDHVAGKLRAVIEQHGIDSIGALVSPSASCEELYLAQKFMRAMGCGNIDHRLRQIDFSAQDAAPAYPGLGLTLAAVEQLDAALIIGGFPRKDQPIFNHRLRKAALNGGRVMALNPVDFDFNFELAHKCIAPPAGLIQQLAAVLKAALGEAAEDEPLGSLLVDVHVDARSSKIASELSGSERSAVFLGALAVSHPQFSLLRFLAARLAQQTGATPGYLEYGANNAGAWLAGAVPHRLPGMAPAKTPGLDANAMLSGQLAGYLLLEADPTLDCYDGRLAREAMNRAECVVALSGFRCAAEYADVMLPLALYAENPGSYLNMEGRRQTADAVVAPAGSARPAWKIICSLAASQELDGFTYDGFDQVRAETAEAMGEVKPDNFSACMQPETLAAGNGSDGLARIGYVPMNSVDALARHAPALQQTADIADTVVRINRKTAEKLRLDAQQQVRVVGQSVEMELPLMLDDSVADGAALIHGGHAATAGLGPLSGPVTLNRV